MGKITKMDVVFDTGSDWLVVEGSNCTSCQGNTYDIQPNLDLGIAKIASTKNSTRSYGSAELEGIEYTDTVCALFSACVKNFKFFLFHKQKGISEPVDGILGMSRNKPFFLSPESGNRSGPLYVEALYNARVISQNKFSFFFTEAGGLSWVDFGEPKLENIRSDAKLETI